MTFRDLVCVSAGNLLRMKLRTSLTVSGIMIAIAAFVAMLSFGAGTQAFMAGEFKELGLFTTMQVYPRTKAEAGAAKPAALDASAVERLSRIPGVKLAYPYDAFAVSATVDGSSVSTKAQALPADAGRTKLFSRLRAGRFFAGDDARQVMVTEQFLRLAKIKDPESIVGKPLTLSVKVLTVDSGLRHVMDGLRRRARDLAQSDLEPLSHYDYLSRLLRTETDSALRRFLDGFLNDPETVSGTFTVCGVLSEQQTGRVRTEALVVPAAAARRFTTSGFSSDPGELLAAVGSGAMFSKEGAGDGKNFPRVTLDVDPKVPHKQVRRAVEAMGFKAASLAEQFDESRRMFVYVDLALGLVGLIALVTATLGVVNTMVMSILERRREIGVLKSLGADDSDIRTLFLVESGVIGAVGSAGGIAFGWLISRAASAVARFLMLRQGAPGVELFALPPWLILAAFAIGVAVSVLAGLYPAGRAARVDPVDALRGE